MGMDEIVVGLFLFVAIGWSIFQVFNILDFFKEVPRQLKRIADALEKRAKMDGGNEDDNKTGT